MNQLYLDAVLTDAGEVPDPGEEILRRGRAALDAARLEAGDELAERRRRRTRRSILIAAVAGAAAVAIAVPVLTVNGHRPAASAAAAVLNQAADAAGKQPGGWPTAAYWYSETRSMSGGVASTRRIWIGHHAHSVLEDPVGSPVMDLGSSAIFPIGSGTALSWDALYALPTDPVALDRYIRAHRGGGGPSADAEVFANVGDLLRESPASPALRKALWQVVARVPGVRLLGPRTDHMGRKGVAVEMGGGGYLVDTSTGTLLEEFSGMSYGTYVRQGPSATAPKATTR